MAKPKYNWAELLESYACEYQQTGIKPAEWCEANNIPIASAKRYITVKAAKAICEKNKSQIKIADEKSQIADRSSANEVKEDKSSGKSLEDSSSLVVRDSQKPKPSGRDSNGRFTEGNPGNPNPPPNPFLPGNQHAVKHGGYAARFDDQTLFDEAEEIRLKDELKLCRARALNCIDTMKQIRKDLANASTVEQRLELYNAIISTEQALDRNVVRIESLERTLSNLRLDEAKETYIASSTVKNEAQTEKLKLEADKLAKEGKGSTTPVDEVVADVQDMGSDGLMSGMCHD